MSEDENGAGSGANESGEGQQSGNAASSQQSAGPEGLAGDGAGDIQVGGEQQPGAEGGGESGPQGDDASPEARDDEHFVEIIAQICNDANAAYCESIGDATYGVWANVPENIRASCRDGVRKHLQHPGLTPEQSHAAWLEFKTADGYTYGPVRNEELKQHPCMVPYADLPQAQRSKDFIFRAIVHAVVRATGN